MGSETLSLFPSPVSSIPPKSCLRQAVDIHARHNTPSPTLSSKSCPTMGLRGLALQLKPQTGKLTHVEAATPARQSLFCNPAKGPSVTVSELKSASPASETLSRNKKRPAVAIRKISMSTTSSETQSVLSGSPTLVRSNSASSMKKDPPPPLQSIFPEYDPALPLSQQRYHPTGEIQRPQLQRRDCYRPSVADVPSPATPVPAAGLSQLQALWNAANGQPSGFHSDKIRLTMHRDGIGAGSTATELRFGSQEGRTLYSVSVAESSKEFMIRRHHPARTGILPIAQVDLATPQDKQETSTTIFSQQAALTALEAAAKTHKANSIAQYDPRASSPQAAQLAFDAVAEAKSQESCQLVRSSCGSNGFGIEEHKYELRHPRLGVFEVSVEGEIDVWKKDGSKRPATGRILLHHPYTSPAKSSSKPPVLLSFDTGAKSLDVDVASFRRLDSSYMIDSAISSVLAVALMEVKSQKDEVSATFPAPPASPVKLKDGKPKDSRWRRALKKRKDKKTPSQGEEKGEDKLPGVTRGILYMLGFSFEAIVWLLGLGVKVLSKVIVCISGAVVKS